MTSSTPILVSHPSEDFSILLAILMADMSVFLKSVLLLALESPILKRLLCSESQNHHLLAL